MKRLHTKAVLAALFAALTVFGVAAPASATTYTWSGWVCKTAAEGGTACFHWRLVNTGTQRRVDTFGWGYNTDSAVTGFALQQDGPNGRVGSVYTQQGSALLYQYQTGVISTTTFPFLSNSSPENIDVTLWAHEPDGSTRFFAYQYTHAI